MSFTGVDLDHFFGSPLGLQPYDKPPVETQAAAGVPGADLKSAMEDAKNHGEELHLDVDKRTEYFLSQVKLTLSWRLKHHHSELLKEFQDLFAPVTTSITFLQEEITRLQGELLQYKTSVKTAVMKDESTQSTSHMDFPAATMTDPLTISGTTRKESSVQTEDPGYRLGHTTAPVFGSNIVGENNINGKHQHQPFSPATCAVMFHPKRLPVTDETIRHAQKHDPFAQNLYMAISKGEVLAHSTGSYTILDGKLYRVLRLPLKTIYQLYVPPGLRQQLICHFHNDHLSHVGRHKTYRRLQVFVFWPGMSRDVRNYVHRCQVCQMFKPVSQGYEGERGRLFSTPYCVWKHAAYPKYRWRPPFDQNETGPGEVSVGPRRQWRGQRQEGPPWNPSFQPRGGLNIK